MISTKIIRLIASLSLLFALCAPPGFGWCMTPEEMNGYKTIPTASWLTLTRELQTQKDELNQLQDRFRKLSRPSMELQNELKKAKEQLQKLQTELENARTSLNVASKDLAESKTSLATLRQQIDKERRVHRRQVWQNRLWCLLGGAAIGFAAAK